MNDVVYRSAEAAAAVETQYQRVLEQWPVPKTELHVLTRQGSTFVVACGPENAPPVVLLHGSMANSAAWVPDVALWSTKFRLFAIDMIGEAGFSARVRPDLAGDAHALWLDDVFEGLGLGSGRARVAIVGTSLGGWPKRRTGASSAMAMCLTRLLRSRPSSDRSRFVKNLLTSRHKRRNAPLLAALSLPATLRKISLRFGLGTCMRSLTE